MKPTAQRTSAPLLRVCLGLALGLGGGSLVMLEACSEAPHSAAGRHAGVTDFSVNERSSGFAAQAAALADVTAAGWSPEELAWIAAQLARDTEVRGGHEFGAPATDLGAWGAWGYAAGVETWHGAGAFDLDALGYANSGAWQVPTGDAWNSWSSTYAHGASNADNSAGYVYVPGSGAVSYGF
ncbi:MAG: hypothetical protein L6Q99_08575 [Planctomycetes bacterium]|nr:hypothetical protein [Planctomycetota bacterium]